MERRRAGRCDPPRRERVINPWTRNETGGATTSCHHPKSSPRSRRSTPSEHIPAEDKIIHLHYFSDGSDHYLAEVSQREEDEHWIGFGWAALAAFPEGAEWGHADLTEMETMRVRVRGLPIIVERDLHWTAKPFRLVQKKQQL